MTTSIDGSLEIANRFVGRLDGGACVNQRSLGRAFELFGAERKPAAPGDLSLSALLDALWMLDLMTAHPQLSYDGTLPDADLGLVAQAADAFCERTGWRRASVVALAPRNEDDQLSMQVSAASDMVGLLDEPAIPGLDVGVSDAEARRFFEALQAHASAPGHDRSNDDDWREQLVRLGRHRFRGSKCVAGLAGLGPEAVASALALRDRHAADPGVAVGMLINRFRAGYLRHLAADAGDVFVPGAASRRLSAANARTTHAFVVRALGDTYLDSVRGALGGADGISTALLPPLGLYCLMAAQPAHGPRGVVERAMGIAKDYRTVLNDLTKVAIDAEATFDGWTQPTPDGRVDALNRLIEERLTARLGAIDTTVARWRGGNPPGYDRYFTYFSKLFGKQVSSAAGAVIGSALSGPLGVALGGAAGFVVGDAFETRLMPAARRRLFGHVDAFRALDNYLTDPAVSARHLPALEEQVRDVLGMRLVR